MPPACLPVIKHGNGHYSHTIMFHTCRRVIKKSFAFGRMLHSSDSVLRRSYLYVPCSNPRMLEKSTSVDSDVIVYDLEDSVAPKDKEQARNNLIHFLGVC